MKDPVIKPKNLEKFETAFKNSATIKFETAGHFPQEEVAAEVIKSMRTFLTEKHHKD